MGTVPISMLQAWGFAIKLNAQHTSNGLPVVPESGPLFFISAIFILTAGTIFMMWLGEQITEHGIGNGISLIIAIGIIARLPQALWQEWNLIAVGSRSWVIELILLALLVGIIAAVILVTQGARRIPVQYARRQVGRKTYGGTTQYIPLRVNTAGVMPIIFAHGMEDSYVPTIMSVQMASARMSNRIGLTDLVLIPGAGHAVGILTDKARWLAAVDSFIDRVFYEEDPMRNSVVCNEYMDEKNK